MKKNKKIFLSLIMLLFTIFFTGCGSNYDNNDNNNSLDNEQEVPETPIYIHKGEYKNSPWGFTPLSMTTTRKFFGAQYEVEYRVIIYNNNIELKTINSNAFTIELNNYGENVYYEKAKINDGNSVTINGYDSCICFIKFTVGGAYLKTGTKVSFYYLTTMIGSFEDIKL